MEAVLTVENFLELLEEKGLEEEKKAPGKELVFSLPSPHPPPHTHTHQSERLMHSLTKSF